MNCIPALMINILVPSPSSLSLPVLADEVLISKLGVRAPMMRTVWPERLPSQLVVRP